MHPYVRLLKSLYEQNANPTDAAPMKKYMRGQFEYLGIKTPLRVALQKGFIKEHGLPPLGELDIIMRELWSLPQREFQYTATSLLGKLETKLEPEFISTVEYLIVTKSWWDTVDTLAGNSLQALRSTVHEKISFFGDSSNQKPPGSLFSQSLAVFD
jgi:3-methyladenine DNA glycosylase AlkD